MFHVSYLWVLFSRGDIELVRIDSWEKNSNWMWSVGSAAVSFTLNSEIWIISLWTRKIQDVYNIWLSEKFHTTSISIIFHARTHWKAPPPAENLHCINFPANLRPAAGGEQTFLSKGAVLPWEGGGGRCRPSREETRLPNATSWPRSHSLSRPDPTKCTLSPWPP